MLLDKIANAILDLLEQKFNIQLSFHERIDFRDEVKKILEEK